MDNLKNNEIEQSAAIRLTMSRDTARACRDQIGCSITTNEEEEQWRAYREMLLLFKSASTPEADLMSAAFDELDSASITPSEDPMERLLAALQPSVYDYHLTPEPVRKRDSNYSLAGEFIADEFESVLGFEMSDEVFDNTEKIILRKRDRAVHYLVTLQVIDEAIAGTVEVTDNSHVKDFDSDKYLDDESYRDIWDALECQKTIAISVDEFFGDQKPHLIEEVIRQLDKSKRLAENIAANPALFAQWLVNY